MATMLIKNQWVLLSEQYLGNSGGNLYVRLWAKLWGSDIATNRSYVYIEAWAYYTGSWIKDNQGSGYVTDGTKSNSGSCTYLTNGETKIAGIEGWYTHDDDGTLDIDAEAYLNFPNWGWSAKASGTCTLPRIARKAELTSAPDFTDEDNPTIYFTNPAGSAVTTQVCISWTGGDDISYRNINNPTDTSYTFKFKEDELNKLYDATISKGSNSIPVTFYVTTWSGSTLIGASTLQRRFTVVDCAPTLNPDVLDHGSTSTQLTENPNILIRYFNYPRAVFNATGTKRASIVSRTVTCGNQTLTGTGDYVQFNNVDNNKFIFTIVDNRGNKVSKTITKEMIDYVIPTCKSSITTDLSSDNKADINIFISGNCYDGSFGTQDNVIVVEYRYRTNDEPYPVDENGTEIWIGLPFVTDKQNNTNTYSTEVTLSDLDYKGTYTIQSRIRDTINYGNIYAKEEIIKIVPTFDWDDDDFKFNVPVTVEGSLVQTVRCFSAYTDSRHHEITFTHNKSYGLTKFPLELIGINSGKEAFMLSDGEIEIVDDISLIRVYASLGINDNGCYYCITTNGGYGRTPNSPILLAPKESNIGYCTGAYVQILQVQKGDKIGLYIGKQTAFTTTVDAVYLTVEVIE